MYKICILLCIYYIVNIFLHSFNNNEIFISAIFTNFSAFFNTLKTPFFLSFNFLVILSMKILFSIYTYFILVILIFTLFSYIIYKIFFKFNKFIELNLLLFK